MKRLFLLIIASLILPSGLSAMDLNPDEVLELMPSESDLISWAKELALDLPNTQELSPVIDQNLPPIKEQKPINQTTFEPLIFKEEPIEAPYTCPYPNCGKILKNQKGYDYHVQGHGPRSMRCPACGKFYSRPSFRSHLNKVHKNKKS